MSNFTLTVFGVKFDAMIVRLIRIDRFVFGSTSNSHRFSEKSKNPR